MEWCINVVKETWSRKRLPHPCNRRKRLPRHPGSSGYTLGKVKGSCLSTPRNHFSMCKRSGRMARALESSGADHGGYSFKAGFSRHREDEENKKHPVVIQGSRAQFIFPRSFSIFSIVPGKYHATRAAHSSYIPSPQSPSRFLLISPKRQPL